MDRKAKSARANDQKLARAYVNVCQFAAEYRQLAEKLFGWKPFESGLTPLELEAVGMTPAELRLLERLWHKWAEWAIWQDYCLKWLERAKPATDLVQ